MTRYLAIAALRAGARHMSRVAAILLITAMCLLAYGMAQEAPKAEPQAKELPKAAPAATAGERWPDGRTVTGATEHEKRIHAALAEPFSQEFLSVPLSEIVKLIEEKAKCAVVLDLPALTADGIGPEKKFNGRARGRSLRQELRSLLASERLVFVVRNDSIWISTRTAAELYTPIRLYQVHDLVIAPTDRHASKPAFENLIDLIRGSLAAESWRDHGGTQGEIRAIEAPGVVALAISQTAEVHESIEQLFSQLRAARLDGLRQIQEQAAPDAGAESAATDRFAPESSLSLPAPSPTPRGKVIYPRGNTNANIRKALDQPAKFHFVSIRLDDVIVELEKQFGISAEYDVAALTADGKGPCTIVTFSWRDGTLRNGLHMMLDQQGLTFLIRDGVLVITTRTDSETQLSTHVYQVHDLLKHNRALIGQIADLESFTDIIRSLISPEYWRDSSVALSKLEAPGLQIIATDGTEQIHREIEQFLSLIREAHEPKVYEAQRTRPVIVPPPPPTPQPSSFNPGSVQGLGGGF